MYKKLYKVRHGAKIDGVCGGLANYLNMDPTIMRIVWVIGALILNFPGIIAYVVCSLIIPREPDYYDYNDYNTPNNNHHGNNGNHN